MMQELITNIGLVHQVIRAIREWDADIVLGATPKWLSFRIIEMRVLQFKMAAPI